MLEAYFRRSCVSFESNKPYLSEAVMPFLYPGRAHRNLNSEIYRGLPSMYPVILSYEINHCSLGPQNKIVTCYVPEGLHYCLNILSSSFCNPLYSNGFSHTDNCNKDEIVHYNILRD